jgi:hypothetical protein
MAKGIHASHATVQLVLLCPVCARTFWRQIAALQKLDEATA